MAKDFSKIRTAKQNTGTDTGEVFETIEQGRDRGGLQSMPSAEEKAEREATLRTQGRRGCKLIRLNLGMTPEAHSYVSIMAKATGRSQAKFVNDLVMRDMEEHAEQFEAAKALLQMLNPDADKE